ncbi:MAG: transposase [Paracoccus sp. (in: a-proteobacteria)]
MPGDHVHTVIPVPPKLIISDLVRMVKGRLSFRI